ncbi:hypothetical protein [Pedobacter jamesrossensis]|uniref:Uncharacterized protein n=1 Tax=Pedobacter jamesrossensis TaxID=1908238 RepID=A0ABV8NL85_9SPHI
MGNSGKLRLPYRKSADMTGLSLRFFFFLLIFLPFFTTCMAQQLSLSVDLIDSTVLNLSGVKGKHNPFDASMLYATSAAIIGLSTHFVKQGDAACDPMGYNSFHRDITPRHLQQQSSLVRNIGTSVHGTAMQDISLLLLPVRFGCITTSTG